MRTYRLPFRRPYTPRTGAEAKRLRLAAHDQRMQWEYGSACRYTIFRAGFDECGKCGKPYAEHQVVAADG